MSVALLFLVAFLGSFSADSTLEEPEYLVRNYTVEDGLPVNSVNGIVQGDKGYLFFSTLDGLVRYDGYDFVTYSSSNSKGIYNNRIAGVMKASTGRLWMVSESGALTAYEHASFKTYSTEDGVQDDVISIKEGKQRKIWIGTSSGVDTLNRKTNTFTDLNQQLLSATAWAIEPIENNGVLAVNEHGLVRWREGSANILLTPGEFPVPYKTTVQIKSVGNNLLCLTAEDGFFCLKNGILQPGLSYISDNKNIKFWEVDRIRKNHLLFTSTHGFFELNTEKKTVTKLTVPVNISATRTQSVLFGKEGELILLGDDEVIIDGQIVFRAENIRTGFVDDEGSIWVASAKEGLFQLRRSSFSNITPSGEYPVENIYPIIQTSDGAVWAGSFYNGIFRFDESGTTQWNTSNSRLSNNLARYLFEDRNGTLYAGLWDEGLWTFDSGNWSPVKGFNTSYPGLESAVEVMYRYNPDSLFIGTHGQTIVQTGDEFNIFRDRAGNSIRAVRVIRKNNRGEVFFGTNGSGLGLLSIDHKLKKITTDDGLSSNFIRDIYLQSEDTVWLATEDQGLNRIIFSHSRNIESVKHITRNDGLIDNSLHRIIEDPSNNLWISSNNGIMRLPKANLNAYANGSSSTLSVLGFDERNGMVNREANGGVQSAGILTADGKLWFPNQKGITIVDPTDPAIKEALPVSKPVIEHIALQDSLIDVSDISGIRIPTGERNIRFKFTAPNFAYPERVQFKYRLTGVDQNWRLSNEALEADYTNLNPGNYRFDIAAERINDTWAVTSVSFSIPPYFYETYWFYTLLAAGFLLFIYSGYKYRLGALQRREQKLQRLVDEQTKELQKAAEQKTKFFTGITHELKTPLSLILGPLDDIVESRESIPDKKISNYHQMMRRNGYRLKNLVDQILDVSKLNADAIQLTLQPADLEEFTLQIAGQFQSLIDQKNLQFKINKARLSEEIYVDKQAWERVIINLMSNAIKFSPPGERIILGIAEKEDFVNISIQDFGKGITKENQHKVFGYLYQVDGDSAAEGTGIGLFLVKELIERMGGSISLKSGEGKGAKFTVSLRKGYNHFDNRDEVKHESLNLKTTQATERFKSDNIKKHETQSNVRHILIVEDNRDFRNYLQSLLSDEYQISVAGNGKKALEKMEQITPDLIISDVMMPGMDGLTFVNKVRDIEKFKHLPVIFLSAKDRDVDIEAGLSTGADIYLTKPIRSKTLRSQISAVLRRERILQEQQESRTEDAEEATLKDKVRKIVYRQLGNPKLNVEMLADALLMSRSKLYREWKKVSDITLSELIKKIRLDEGKDLILEEDFSVQEAAYAVGFPNPNYFSTSFKEEFDQSPSELLE